VATLLLKRGVRLIRWSLVILCLAASVQAASVWKVSRSDDHVLYLGGSLHALRPTDYPLPSAYNRAFDASSNLVLEDDPATPVNAIKKFYKSAYYPKGDALKNHLDPRTYDYLRRFVGLHNVPEAELEKLRPWALLWVLWSSSTNPLGVEAFLAHRAQANHKLMSGLESFREHSEVVSGLPDKQAELALLQTFISASAPDTSAKIVEAWRKGDVETIARLTRDDFRDLPSLYERMVLARNRAWMVKLERFLDSDRTYFVVVGAGHLGGPEGLLALLRSRGYQIEQI
jgi:uncharacterized protein YbaP (TraB family)